MKPAALFLRRVTACAVAALLACGWAWAADKKDEKKDEKKVEKKADDKKAPVDPKKGGDPKAPEKDGKPATNAVPLVVPFPKATFNVALEAGKDPFFPASKRRFPKPPPVVKPPTPPPTTNSTTIVIGPPPVTGTNPPPATTTNVVVKPPEPPPELIGSANLSLRGIAGGKTRRVATVHSGVKTYDFLRDSEMLIRLPNEKQLKVRCLEIRHRSAVFQVDDETKPRELFLRDGIIF